MLYLAKTIEEYKDIKSQIVHKSVGLIPTMGNLHKGHISLLKESLKENELSVVTIFVNPTQFGKGEDFDKYPRTLEQDLQHIEKVATSPVIVFAPNDEKEIYPNGFSGKVSAGKLGRILEGEIRPGHFDGVVTVVKRLFDIFKPDNAYFGKKDYQQFVLIESMTKEQKLKTKVRGLPTIREASGLALSSRNNYLKESERQKGLKLKQTLEKVKSILKEKKELKPALILIEKEMKTDSSFNYIAIKDAKTLEDPKEVKSSIVILGNYQVNNVRLLDNLEVEF